jgi:hypothetical protein
MLALLGSRQFTGPPKPSFRLSTLSRSAARKMDRRDKSNSDLACRIKFPVSCHSPSANASSNYVTAFPGRSSALLGSEYASSIVKADVPRHSQGESANRSAGTLGGARFVLPFTRSRSIASSGSGTTCKLCLKLAVIPMLPATLAMWSAVMSLFK